MIEVNQELMTPHEAARWFRRSPSWLRQQTDLLRLGTPAGQPLYHVRVCRAYVLGRIAGLASDTLHQLQLRALAAACGVTLGNQESDDSATMASASASAMAPS